MTDRDRHRPAPGAGRSPAGAHEVVARPRKPAWLKVGRPAPCQYRATEDLVEQLRLHTVCREARCPNKGECYAAGTATFLILGDVCTRSCRFCSVRHAGSSGAAAGVPDPDEPRRVADAARRLGLRHVVVTSVTRDDLADGGAAAFAAVVTAVREASPESSVEVLIPDLGGDEPALAAVLAARPDVLNHNVETVPRLYATVRPQAAYERSLELLHRAADWARGACPPAGESPAGSPARRPLVKTGLMVGLGEEDSEIEAVLADCAGAGVDLVTVGQYLQPDAACLPVERYVTPDEFARIGAAGEALGMRMRAAPFARSSYRAGEDAAAAQ